MKVWFVMEFETFKDDAKRKEYYDYLKSSWRPTKEKTYEGVTFKNLGGWSDYPGWVMYVEEFESMEEFSKVWSNEEYQKEILKLRNHVKSFKMRIMRPTVSV